MSRHHKNLVKINEIVANINMYILISFGVLKNLRDKKTVLNKFNEFIKGHGLKSTIWNGCLFVIISLFL